MSGARGQWVEANRKSPCRICGRMRWCSRSADGALISCRWQSGAGSVERHDKNGAPYWIYPQSGQSRLSVPSLLPTPQPDRADGLTLDRVYRALLSSLPLETQHRQNLRKRGLDDGEIQQRSYRTLAQTGCSRIARQLVEQFGPDLCARVPGIVQRQGDRGVYWTLGALPGLLIPVRNADCSITGLVVRPDKTFEGGKYFWLSSSSRGGPSALVSCHVPVHTSDTKIIRLTEGVLKADVATALSGILTIGLPGVGPWRLALPILEYFKPDSVYLALDSDWRSNPTVARSLGECAKQLNKNGLRVQMEDWHPNDGKGIDDLLANGHLPVRKGWAACLAAMYRGTARVCNRTA